MTHDVLTTSVSVGSLVHDPSPTVIALATLAMLSAAADAEQMRHLTNDGDVDKTLNEPPQREEG